MIEENAGAAGVDELVGAQIKLIGNCATAGVNSMLKSYNMRAPEASVLSMIVVKPGITSSEISKVLRLRPANMTPIVNSLVKSGYVQARRKDGRSASLFVVPDRAEEALAIVHSLKKYDEEYFGFVTEEQRALIRDIFSKIRSR